jgi:hypothetical protein
VGAGSPGEVPITDIWDPIYRLSEITACLCMRASACVSEALRELAGGCCGNVLQTLCDLGDESFPVAGGGLAVEVHSGVPMGTGEPGNRGGTEGSRQLWLHLIWRIWKIKIRECSNFTGFANAILIVIWRDCYLAWLRN